MTWLHTFLLAWLAAWLGFTLFFPALERYHMRRSRYRPDLEEPPASPADDAVVILVHGTLYPAFTMRPLAAGLEAAGYRVWLYEYRYLQPIEENARLLERHTQERLDALGPRAPGRVVVAGFSQGGLLLRWLLSGHGRAPWLNRVAGLIQIAAPNLGSPVAFLERTTFPLLRRPGAFMQMTSGSGFLAALESRPLRAGLAIGVIYGEGPGHQFLSRLFLGTTVSRGVPRAIGRAYEAWFLSEGPHDGLVPVASALGILTVPGAEEALPPRPVATDHLGLLVDPEARRHLVDLTGEVLRRRGAGAS